ncbi:MAG TPA: hypothetical protein PLK34_02535 [Candidatus Pacearchaeota archaeon]|nr:hypothetical protein [Candidatus Pacearchaeota archaeon]
MKNNKRGSHVGVILSFAIFITFVMFLYVLVQPNLVDSETQVSALRTLQRDILQNVSDNLTITGVKISIPAGSQSCLRLQDFFINTQIGDRLLASDEIGTTFEMYKSSDNNGRDLLLYSGQASDKWAATDKTVIRIYNSSEFEIVGVQTPSDPPGGQCNKQIIPPNYLVGYTSTREVVMASKLNNLIEIYNRSDPFLGYIPLKEKFGLVSDFGFNFTYQNKTSVGTTKQVSQSRAVEVLETPVIYCSPNRIIESGSLNVRIW